MNTIIDNSSFIEWLNGERDKHGWTSSRLAILAEFSSTQIYYIEQNKRKPGPEVCDKIAKLLKCEPSFVYRMANILPPKTGSDEDMEKGKHYLEILSETHKKQALEFMEFLLRQEENDL